jgi:hypothetical protein
MATGRNSDEGNKFEKLLTLPIIEIHKPGMDIEKSRKKDVRRGVDPTYILFPNSFPPSIF